MIERKKKLRLIQFLLLTLGFLIIYFTYYSKEKKYVEVKIQDSRLKNNEVQDDEGGDIFFNIEYSGIDLNGNRYVLKSEEATVDEIKPEIIYMKFVLATFYFKDDTTLYVRSDEGIYNNKKLDMEFEKNVKANYQNSELFAERANYSNSESYLSIYENVRVRSLEGNMVADKFLFDLEKNKLNISSFIDGEINANVNLNEKRF